jgi:outer membrane protein assembly factor BamB
MLRRSTASSLLALAFALTGCSVDPFTPDSLGVTPASASVAVGATLQLTAVPKDNDGGVVTRPIDVAWTTSDATVATVSSGGLVTGVKVGTATITATAFLHLATAAISVTSGNTTPTLVCRAGTDSVLEHHANSCRDGRYIAAGLNRGAASSLTLDASFVGTLAGATFFAQPLYVANGPGGKAMVIAVSEQNQVYALDAANGAMLWHHSLGTPVPLARFACGNIDPLGVTGTPVIDATSRTLFVAAMTTPDDGTTKKQMVYALSIDDGTVKTNWPVDISAKVTANGLAFDSAYQGNRGALAFIGGTLYVPYGGFYGDCGTYHGWLVAISPASPQSPSAWATSAKGGGPWGPGGVASDGTSLFMTTGNTSGTSTWGGGEAVLRFSPGPVLADSYAPANWLTLDQQDLDLGGTGPVMLDLPGATPATLAFALGKDGKIYLTDRTSLGGVGGAAVVTQVASNSIITAAAAYTTTLGTYVVFHATGAHCPVGQSGDLTAVKLVPGSPPTVTTAWCATQNGKGSPIVTSTDGTAQSVVWSLGAEGDNKLHGYNGDTGELIFSSPALSQIRRFQTPIVGGGRIFVASDGAIQAFH